MVSTQIPTIHPTTPIAPRDSRVSYTVLQPTVSPCQTCDLHGCVTPVRVATVLQPTSPRGVTRVSYISPFSMLVQRRRFTNNDSTTITILLCNIKRKYYVTFLEHQKKILHNIYKFY